MTKTITFLLATLFAITSFGQTFEGKIVYKTNQAQGSSPVSACYYSSNS